MGLRLSGSITVALANEKLRLLADGFSLEEDGHRDRGDGDSQYEALFIYFDDQERFRVSVEAVQLNGGVTRFELSIDGAELVEDNLSVDAT